MQTIAKDRGTGDLAAVVGWLAVALAVYVSLEPWVLALLPASWYWPIRLLPDALIALFLLIVLVHGGRHPPVPLVVAFAVGVGSAALAAAEVGRGASISDSINAVRVIVRYLFLGLLFWWVVERDRRFGDRLVQALAVAVAIQLVAAAVQTIQWLGSGGSLAAIPALDGMTGRYDRLGLLLMAALIVALSRVDPAGLRRWWPGIATMLLGLFLTTSRQADLALGAGCVVLAFLPHRAWIVRGSILAVAACGVMMLVLTPTRISLASTGDEPGPPGSEPAVVPPPTSPPIHVKGSSQLSIDPNRNFRLYLTLALAPWAATQEPIIGFGPGSQIAVDPDPRLAAKLAEDGTNWAWARYYMNDSTYASWVIQFGFVAPTAWFVGLLLAGLMLLIRALRGPRRSLEAAGLALIVAMLVVSAFGPAFETRTISIVFWLVLGAALAGPAIVAGGSPATRRLIDA